MKLLHLVYEFPLSTNHGGRLNIWQHVCGFNELGFETIHIIPKSRIAMDYLIKLSKAALKSS